MILIPENDGIHYIVAKVPICKRCHRKLKTPEAIERGMGKVCWEKTQKENEQKRLFGVDKKCKG